MAGLGTTGTFTGTGRYLKERNPAIELVAVQPEDELAVIEGLKHLETAIVPGIYDARLPDRTIGVPADDAWQTCAAWRAEAGLFVGMSAGGGSGGSLCRGAAKLDSGTVVTILPDDGSKYVSLGYSGRENGHKTLSTEKDRDTKIDSLLCEGMADVRRGKEHINGKQR